MNSTTAMIRTLASRCFSKNVALRPRMLPAPFRPRCDGGVPVASGLTSAVSLKSLIPIPLLRRMLVFSSHTQVPWRLTAAFADGEPPRACTTQCRALRRSGRDRPGVLDVLLRRGGALEAGLLRGVRVHVALDNELQAGVRLGRRNQPAGELEQVEVQRGQEALQVRRLVDGEVDLARLDRGQGLRLQVE